MLCEIKGDDDVYFDTACTYKSTNLESLLYETNIISAGA